MKQSLRRYIASGGAESHPGSGATPFPYDAALSPPVAQPTATVGQLTGPTAPGAVFPYAGQIAADEAACHQAQAAGMAAENDRRHGYAGQILPLGGQYGTQMDLPPVPPAAVPPASSDLHPWSGDEPVPAGAGLDFYPGTPPE